MKVINKKSLLRKAINMTLAFSLVLSSVSASVPIILSQTAFAASTVTTSVADLAATVAAASNGDIIDITTTGTITSQVVLNKSLTLTSSNNTVVNVAPGINAIGIQANNVTIENLDFEGTWNFGDGAVTRALEVSTSTNTTIKNNTFKHLRQPAYINDNTTGTISNNFTDVTKGWVVISNTDLTFTNNTWGENVIDVAILAGASNNYNDSRVVTISDTNNDAVVENQFGPSKRLSDSYVAAASNGRSGDDGSKWNPYTSVQPTLDRIVDGGTVHIGAGTFAANVSATKPAIIKGIQSGVDARTRSSNETVLNAVGSNTIFNVTSNNVIIDGFTLNGPAGGSAAISMMGGNSNEAVTNNIFNNKSRAVVFNTNNTTLSKNRINNADTANYVSGFEENSSAANNVVIDSNDFYNGNRNADINFIGSTAATSNGLEVKANKSINGVSFLGLTNTTGASVTSNTVSGTPDRAIFIAGNNNGARINSNKISSSTAGAGVIVINPFGYGVNSDIKGEKNNFSANTNGVVVFPGSLASAQTADFSNSWWGSATGPKDLDATDGSSLASNPTGTGAGAFGAVKYTAWCITDACAMYSDQTLAAPTNLTPANGTSTKDTAFTNTWSAVAGAAGYEYQTSNTSNGTTLGSIIYSDTSTAQPSHYDLSGSTIKRFNSGTPNGNYYWQVRTVNAQGVAGPWSVVTLVIVDTVAPQITVKSGVNFTTGSNGTFSKVSFSLYDNDKVVKYTINGAVHTVTPNMYSDANFITTGDGSGAVYGANTIVLYDAAGNTTSYSFVMDNVGPTVTIKDTSTGSNGAYRNIDFKLYDAYKVASYSVNGGTLRTLTPNQYSDANDISVGVNGGVYGANTIAVTDVAGNTTTLQFVLDNQGPTITVKDTSTGSNGVYKSVDFKLYDQYKVSSFNVNGGTERILTPNQYSDANDISVGSNGGVAGLNTIVVKDVAGNSSSLQFILDNVGPTITVKSGYIGNLSAKIFSNVSFQLYDANKVDKYVLNGLTSDFTNNEYSDANFQNIVSRLVQGQNTLTLYDVAGNTTSYVFTYDSVAQAVPVHETPVNNAFLNVNDFYFEWNDVSGAVKYELQNSQNPAVGSDGSFTNVQWTGDYQQVQPTDSKARSVGANGTWYWQVRSVDAAGNKSAWSTPWGLTIDMDKPSAPVVSATGISDNETTNSSPVTINWTKPTADTAKYDYRVWTNASGSPYNTQASAYVDSGLTGNSRSGAFTEGQGSYFVQVRAIDVAGNVSDWSNTFTVVFDSVPPVLTLDDVLSNTQTSRTFSGTTEPGASVEVTVHSTPQTKTATVTSNGNWTVTFDNLEVGPHTVVATSKDGAGNTLTSSEKTFEVTTPVVTPTGQTGENGNGTSNGSAAGNGTGTVQTTNATNTGSTQGLLALNNTSATDTAQTTTPASENGEVLGTQDSKKNVAATGTVQKAADGTFNVFGIAWYWLLLALAAIAAAWWMIAAYRRRQEQEA